MAEAAVWGIRPLRLAGVRRFQPETVATVLAAVLGLVYIVLPLQDDDLSAQLARAAFAAQHPTSLVDFRWFGGVLPYGYTLWATLVMALVGVKATGALAAVVGTWYSTRCLRRLAPARLMAGGIALAIEQVSNVVEGRITFACGLACGAIALSALLSERLPARYGYAVAALFSLAAGAASPVATLALWVVGGTALVMRNRRDALLLMLPSAASTGVISIVFGDGGRQPFTVPDILRTSAVLAVVLLVVPRRYRAVRIAVLIDALVVVAAYVLPTPIGSNAMRMSLLFAFPVVLACSRLSRRTVVAACVAILCAQYPIQPSTLFSTGSAHTQEAYYTPLGAEISRLGIRDGRLEIPDMQGHWDSYYLAASVPLARGWLRQTDIKLNDTVLYDGEPTAAEYRRFLDDNSVQYVAVPDAPLSTSGEDEARFLRTSPQFLHLVWQDAHWKLYTVRDYSPITPRPAAMLYSGPNEMTLSAPGESTIPVNVRWFSWLRLSSPDPGACIADNNGRVVLHTVAGGRYTLTSTAFGPTGQCPEPDTG